MTVVTMKRSGAPVLLPPLSRQVLLTRKCIYTNYHYQATLLNAWTVKHQMTNDDYLKLVMIPAHRQLLQVRKETFARRKASVGWGGEAPLPSHAQMSAKCEDCRGDCPCLKIAHLTE